MYNSNDWSQFYANPPHPISSTAQSTQSTNANANANAVPAVDNGMSVSTAATGGISKPTRRRSRTSRRTPTPTLETDTANFRAMVQQYTGGPTAAASFSLSSNPSMFVSPPGGGGGFQFRFGDQLNQQSMSFQSSHQRIGDLTNPNLNPNLNPNFGSNLGDLDEFGSTEGGSGGSFTSWLQ